MIYEEDEEEQSDEEEDQQVGSGKVPGLLHHQDAKK